MAVAYRNKNTQQVVGLPEPDPRLEALNEWERVPESEITYSVADAHDRAAAERASIEAAAAIRLDSAAGAAAAGIAVAQAANTAIGGPGQPQPLPTLSTGTAGEVQQPVALLDKGDPMRDTGATSYERNKQAADAEIANPPTEGVLTRAKRDQRTGATQIGDAAERDAKVADRAAAKAGDSTSARATADKPAGR